MAAVVAVAAVTLGAIAYHVYTGHPASEGPAFQPDDKVTQDKTTGAWRKCTQKDVEGGDCQHTVRGYSGHRRQAENLIFEGREIWITPDYRDAQTYAKYGPKAAVATIASVKQASQGAQRFEGPYAPDLPKKEDGYVTIAVEKVTPERDQRLPAKLSRCLDDHVKPVLGLSSKTPAAAPVSTSSTTDSVSKHFEVFGGVS